MLLSVCSTLSISSHFYWLLQNTIINWGFPRGSGGKESACNAGVSGSIPGWEGPLDNEMATHSSILAWKVQWTEEPDYSLWG